MRKKSLFVCCVLLIAVIILVIVFLINKDDSQLKQKRRNIADYVTNECSKYIEGKYEYYGCKLDCKNKIVDIVFVYANHSEFYFEETKKIYDIVYEYFFIKNVEEYGEYTLGIVFNDLGTHFNIFDITKDEEMVRIVCNENIKINEIVEMYSNVFDLSCSELKYDSIDELKGFHNLKKLYIDTKITKQEALQIQELLPECKLTWYLMDEINMVDGYYVYPVTQEEVEDHHSDGREKCKIPKTLLERLTAEQLAQAVVDYPYLYNDISTLGGSVDTSAMNFYCNAYAELIKREDGKQAIMEKLKELEQTEYDRYNLYLLKQLLLAEKSFINTYTDEELEYLSE